MTDKDQTTYADKLTLDELGDNDLKMVKDAVKNANRYHFGQDMIKAVRFIKECMDKTLERLGIKVSVPTTKEGRESYAKYLDKEMNDRQIRIEHRNQYKGADLWRCGLYIYQKDELVAFISDVMTERQQHMNPVTFRTTKTVHNFMVITNARIDDTKRIFLMPNSALNFTH